MFDDSTPIYRQIAEQIKQEILNGALLEDEQVMSTNQYAAFYRINPATAQKGFQQLVDEGILYKKRGIGMFVTKDAPRRLREQRREKFQQQYITPLTAEAAKLGIGLEELVAMIESGSDS